jgi:hypothetical protein
MTLVRAHLLAFSFALAGFAQAVDRPPAAPPAAPEGLFNVRAFGAVGDGTRLDTPAIVKAVRAAAAAGGGVVVFPPGTYLTGTFELLSNVSLDLEAGSTLKGSPNMADYPTLTSLGFVRVPGEDLSGDGNMAGMIYARRAANIAIYGNGVIDGNGDGFFDFHSAHVGMDFEPRSTRDPQAFMDAVKSVEDGPVMMKPAGRPGTMIFLSDSNNIILRDVTLRNAPNWTVHLAKSEHAIVTGLRIANNLLLPNNDGIDCIGCRDVHFSNIDIAAGDDGFAIMNSENLTVSNCAITSNSAGVRLENTHFATFDDLVIHANRGIGIFERGKGSSSGILFSNLVIETRLLLGHWWGKAEPIYIATAGTGPALGGVHDVRFSNIVAVGESGMLLQGAPKNLIRNISFEHVRLQIRAPREVASRGVGGNFDLRWTATERANAVFRHDIPGLYCRWADGIQVRGFDMEWDAHLPAYFSHGLEFEDFRNLDIDGFSGRQAAPGPEGAVIALRRGVGVSIRNSRAAEGAATFVATTEVTGEGLFSGNDVKAATRVFEPVKSGFTLYGNLVRPAVKAAPAAGGNAAHASGSVKARSASGSTQP